MVADARHIRRRSRRPQRIHPHVQVRIASPNRSSREGAHPTLIVIHVTAGHNRKGIGDLKGLGAYFKVRANEVSSHVATDNEGHSAVFVRGHDKAWHVMNYNRVALGIEQIAPGTGAEITEAMYQETARWVASFAHWYHIPIRHGRVSGLFVASAGVVRHSDLGVLGGGHSDPGPYDMDRMLWNARRYHRYM